jgi:equilibrative nucleoside transporter 1/2/3
MLWNIGELAGSVLAASSKFLLKHRLLLLILSFARIVFIPLYLMCNVGGRGSFAGDWFYLFVVQLGFGLSHGWLSSASMMGVPEWVAKEDREEAGAFMGMTLVSGLVVGSLLGLVVARA